MFDRSLDALFGRSKRTVWEKRTQCLGESKVYHDAGTSIRHGLYRIFFFSAKRFLNLGCGLFAGASNMRLNTVAFSLGPKCFLFLEEWGDWGGAGNEHKFAKWSGNGMHNAVRHSAMNLQPNMREKRRPGF